MKLFTSIIALLFLTCNPVFGQSPGERVRITTSGRMMIGTVSEMGGEAYKIKLQGGRLQSVAFSEISKLERSLGERNNAKKGFLIGGGIGAVMGIAVGLAIESGGDQVGVDTGGLGIAAGILAAGVWGGGAGLIGLAIGSAIKSEKWEELRIPPSGSSRSRIRPVFEVSSMGGNRRALLGARLRF